MTEKQAENLRIQAENRERRQRKAQEHRERQENKEREWDEACALAWAAFRDSQPEAKLPAWLLINGHCGARHLREGLVQAEISLWKKQHLQYRRESIILSYTPPAEDLVRLFRCTVEFPSKQMTVLLTTDAGKLEAGQFELDRDDSRWCEEEVQRRKL